MSYWDIVRGFAVDGNTIVESGSWFDGTTAPLERLIMAQLIRAFKPEILVEIGTYRGTTTRLMLDNCLESARIFTIDLPPGKDAADLTAATDERLIVHRKLGIDLEGHPQRSQVQQVYGDCFSPETWAGIPDGVDYAFIDGSHSYEAAKNDSEWVFKKMSPDAIIVWHDYTDAETPERGVGRYIRELMRSRDDVFICAETDLAIRIPTEDLRQCRRRSAAFFPNSDYDKRFPNGPTSWLDA